MDEQLSDETRCARTRSVQTDGFSSLSPPVIRASTVVFPNTASFEKRYDTFYDGYTYGLYGTPTSHLLEEQLSALNGGGRTVLTPSGQSAMVLALMTFVGPGEHILVPDAVYGATRTFCDLVLSRIGAIVEFYDPLIGDGIRAHLRPETRLVVVESPGSNTMEVQDVPAIARAAHDAGALVLADNTWAGPLLFKAFEHGADLVMEALSKHAGGHGDVLMGAVTARDEALHRKLKDMTRTLGLGVSADDASLVLRGLQTMALRMERSGKSALRIADWLQRQPAIGQVLHPALPGTPGHALWKRDFRGANGVFSITLVKADTGQEARLIDGLKIFRIGASWGGTQSLVAPQNPASGRTAAPWLPGKVIRLSIGVEAVEDLIADLANAIDGLSAGRAPAAARSRIEAAE